ncbi:MAG: DNA repair protein RadC [Thermoanaerobaculia bacterium]|jgi:DNA repair protein RadC
MPDTSSESPDTLAVAETALDRLLRAGVESLSDAELVSLLLDSKIEKARMLVRDGLPAFARTEWTARRHRMRPKQSARILASLELGRRLTISENRSDPVRDPVMLARSLVARYGHHVQERVGAVFLDAKSRIIREREIYVGTLNSTTVSTRDILRLALDEHAAGIIVFHNHPSGDPNPSADDLLFTKRLVEAGNLLGVDVLDHLILGMNRYVSLKGIKAM